MKLPIALAFAALLLSAATAPADETVINEPIAVPLQRVTVGKGTSSYEKLGIWASLNGGTPQLFEFDTGGDGFYAVYAAGIAPWWGSGTIVSGQAFTQEYSSGNFYTGLIATGAVSIFANQAATQALIKTAPRVAVGQTLKIINTKSHVTLWSPRANRDTAPPVDTVFYGDFGLNLENKGLLQTEQRPTNVFAQLRYGPGVNAGFVVHAGPHRSHTAAYVQVGITPGEMADFPIQIRMKQIPKSPIPPLFPNSRLQSYGLQLFTSDLLVRSGSTSFIVKPRMTLDTGNQTPVLFTARQSDPFAALVVKYKRESILSPGASLAVSLHDGPSIFALTSGLVEGVDKVEVGAAHDGKLSFNVGIPFFERYVVAYNLTTGIIGLRPQPQSPLDVRIFGRADRRAGTRRVRLEGAASGAGLRAVRLVVNGRTRPIVHGVARWHAMVRLQPGPNLVKAYALGPGAKASRPAVIRIHLRQS